MSGYRNLADVHRAVPWWSDRQFQITNNELHVLIFRQSNLNRAPRTHINASTMQRAQASRPDTWIGMSAREQGGYHWVDHLVGGDGPLDLRIFCDRQSIAY
jgi:hypothetical protein